MSYFGPPSGEGFRPYERPNRCAPQWVGGMLAAAGLVTVLGSFVPWITVVRGTYPVAVAGPDIEDDGWFTAFLGAVLVALGIVILVRQGRLWVGIVGIVVATFTVLVGLAELGTAHDAAELFRMLGAGRVEIGPGLILVCFASWAALGASIVAVAVRRP